MYSLTIKSLSFRAVRGAIKKNLFFLEFSRKGGGGGLAESKISLTEKTEIFLDFFSKRGGGLTQSKRVLAEKNGF